MALPPPFPSSQQTLVVLPNPFLWVKLEPLRQDPRFKNMGVQLVDLTTGMNSIGGWNAGATGYAASTVKIAAMFAAFQLRENFSNAAAGIGKDPDDLIRLVTADWRPLVENSMAGAAKDFPNLKKIFDISGSAAAGWIIDFSSAFGKNMEAMIGPSKNDAASFCILSLGYQYIAGALAAEGLYSAADGGLWLAGDYTPGGRDGKPEPKSKSYQAASAAAMIRFMVLLNGKKLVSKKASGEMRKLMSNHFMKRILADRGVGGTITDHFGKLGIGNDGSYHDVAVIERAEGGKRIHYAVAMLRSKGYGTLDKLGDLLDDVVIALN